LKYGSPGDFLSGKFVKPFSKEMGMKWGLIGKITWD